MRNRRCEFCQWWSRREGKDSGECHRHAPTAHQIGVAGDRYARWIETISSDFCGDFEHRANTNNQERVYEELTQ